jgi:threonine/homoserine/homoserine lactone efflux protein
MLAVVFLPQFASGVSLPGSKGSLMLAVGGLAGVVMVLALLQAIGGVLFVNTNFRDLLFLIAVAGGLLMAWAGWQEFQSEGGKFQLGTSAPASAPAAPAAAPAASAAPAAEAAEPAPMESAYADEPVHAEEPPAMEAGEEDRRAAEDDRPVA